jgi:hypothetical protein
LLRISSLSRDGVREEKQRTTDIDKEGFDRINGIKFRGQRPEVGDQNK